MRWLRAAGVPAASSPASASAQIRWGLDYIATVYGMPPADLRDIPADLRDVALAIAREGPAPPELGDIPGDAMLAVAPLPGRLLEEWRHAALGCWIAWPHAADAIHAEEMTAAQLRALLAAQDHG